MRVSKRHPCPTGPSLRKNTRCGPVWRSQLPLSEILELVSLRSSVNHHMRLWCWPDLPQNHFKSPMFQSELPIIRWMTWKRSSTILMLSFLPSLDPTMKISHAFSRSSKPPVWLPDASAISLRRGRSICKISRIKSYISRGHERPSSSVYGSKLQSNGHSSAMDGSWTILYQRQSVIKELLGMSGLWITKSESSIYTGMGCNRSPWHRLATSFRRQSRFCRRTILPRRSSPIWLAKQWHQGSFLLLWRKIPNWHLEKAI